MFRGEKQRVFGADSQERPKRQHSPVAANSGQGFGEAHPRTGIDAYEVVSRLLADEERADQTLRETFSGRAPWSVAPKRFDQRIQVTNCCGRTPPQP